MECPRVNLQTHQTISSSSSRRRRINSDSNSPEFEFWMVRNPSFPQPNLLSADELFVDGVLLPLHLLSLRKSSDPPDPEPEPTNSKPSRSAPEPESVPGPGISSSNFESTALLSTSKRWKDIFKKVDKNKNKIDEENKEKKKERKSGTTTNSSSAELNINLWPFSRSRSAGTAGTRPKNIFRTGNTRKVNSAPCSRSNSAGESKSRKWPSSPGRAGVHLGRSSPGRAGVHLGRSSPVWQVRRGGGSGLRNCETHIRNVEMGSRKEVSESRRHKATAGGSKARVLNLNVPMCIGYRANLSCRSDENSALGVASNGGHGIKQSNSSSVNGGGDGGSGVNIFNLRSIFTKKVY